MIIKWRLYSTITIRITSFPFFHSSVFSRKLSAISPHTLSLFSCIKPHFSSLRPKCYKIKHVIHSIYLSVSNFLPPLRFVLTKVQSSGRYKVPSELTRRRTNGALSGVITDRYFKEKGTTSARGAREAMTEGRVS